MENAGNFKLPVRNIYITSVSASFIYLFFISISIALTVLSAVIIMFILTYMFQHMTFL